MTVEEKIIQRVRDLPESGKAEVLRYVENLAARKEELEWMELSLQSVMQRMENEDVTYTLDDLKEIYS
jgi:uncharacterized membrane protein YccC